MQAVGPAEGAEPVRSQRDPWCQMRTRSRDKGEGFRLEWAIVSVSAKNPDKLVHPSNDKTHHWIYINTGFSRLDFG